MGRLDDIVARNQNPRAHRKGGRFPMGIALAAFVLLILVLMIFTDLDESDDAPPAQPTADPGEKRVEGVGLYRERPRAIRDGGTSD